MNPLVAAVVLKFGGGLGSARTAANAWARTRGFLPPTRDEDLAA